MANGGNINKGVNTREVDFSYLEKLGFKKYRCRKCGKFFWSLLPRDICPDRPCSKYEFLYKGYKKVLPLDIRETRTKFIEFLRSRGHGVIDPYPVLARWRNDLYLTIASIIVFQPAVTEGWVDPPYNPLVIIQPSIRLTDIDNVGLTFGRHLTSFEMGGMHAFNKPGKFVYWTEGIFENTIDFFVKEIGIDLEDLVFKEGWWEGGGNAGPAPEVLIDGMEVATLVHMMYKVVDGNYIINPVLVVDCGYGMERISWLTKRVPTGFHAVYEGLINKYKDILGVEEPPYDILKHFVYVLSDVEISSMDEYLRLIKTSDFNEYLKELESIVYLYSSLDHVRTISLMLSDGIVPSNTGEGYLARLVIRRLLRNILKLGIEPSKLADVVQTLIDEQIKYWKGDYIYGKFEKHSDYIHDVISIEVNKFLDSIYKGIEVLDKLLRKKKIIVLDDLIEIYDSHGIPPEFIAERARIHGLNIEIPSDFYSLVASRHSSPRVLTKEKEQEYPQDLVEWAKSFPPTKRVFHEDPYITAIESIVLGVKENYIVLDKTIMYPWAGGQDHDEGFIQHDDSVYAVKRVDKIGDVIIHVIDRSPQFKPGDIVKVKINWERRYKLMKHHTATHIVLAAARHVLGDHVWQAGAQKTVEKARLDITHHKSLSLREIKEIEKIANSIVESRIDLKFKNMDKYEAEFKHGLRIYQGGAVYSPILRIVEIPGWDAQACFGTHVYNTSEVGGIKIINVEKIQDGVMRLEFIASTRLVDYINSMNEEREKIMEILGVKDSTDLMSAIKRIHSSLENMRSLVEQYRDSLKQIIISTREEKAINICGVKALLLEIPLNDEKLIKDILEYFSIKRNMLITIIYSGNIVEIAINPEEAKRKCIDLRNIVKKLEEVGCKGGGKQDHVIIRFERPVENKKIIESIAETVCTSKCPDGKK
ncbi:MAG: alanine--tRNA ligase [Desulfurococcaceae archaeon]